MKYIIGRCNLSFHLLPIVFPDEVTHSDIADALRRSLSGEVEIISSGFVHFRREDKRWVVGAEKSLSLGIGPRGNDEAILNLFLGSGLSGLDLNNMLTFLQIQKVKGGVM